MVATPSSIIHTPSLYSTIHSIMPLDYSHRYSLSFMTIEVHLNRYWLYMSLTILIRTLFFTHSIPTLLTSDLTYHHPHYIYQTHYIHSFVFRKERKMLRWVIHRSFIIHSIALEFPFLLYLHQLSFLNSENHYTGRYTIRLYVCIFDYRPSSLERLECASTHFNVRHSNQIFHFFFPSVVPLFSSLPYHHHLLLLSGWVALSSAALHLVVAYRGRYLLHRSFLPSSSSSIIVEKSENRSSHWRG